MSTAELRLRQEEPLRDPSKDLARGLLRVQVVLTLTPPRPPVKPALLRPQPSWRRPVGHQHVLMLDGGQRPNGGQPTRRSTGIGKYGSTRTRWTVLAPDLYQVLIEKQLLPFPRPKAFTLPMTSDDPEGIAVMMPLAAEHANVWKTLRAAAEEGPWLCQRADDIWDDSVLVNDIVGLIARSKVVICDLSGRNANVFYETGIAHTLGREVILITQSDNDVPFGLRHHRYIKYLNNSEGLAALKDGLTARLRTLMAR
jgi:hypothetical protein